MPKFSEFLFGKKAKTKQKSTKTPEQEELQNLINEGLKNGSGPFADIYGEFSANDFNEGVTKPQLKQFQDETLPLLQEKFIAGNQVLGSGMRNAQTKAATDLQSKLAELMYNAQNQQKQNRVQGVTNQVNGQNVENVHRPASTGALQAGIKAIGDNAGAITSAVAGGI